MNFLKRQNVSIPSVLLFLLFLGTLAGAGFFIQCLVLQEKVAGIGDEKTLIAELQSLKMSNEWLKNRVAVLQEEKALLIDNAVADLNEKSRVIESILNSVGVDIQIEESKENSGGPFTSSGLEARGDLIFKTERYLDTLQNVPLGAPVSGVITSRFGNRLDPINGEPAYHRGVDIRGRMGSDVKATADATVLIQNYDKLRGRYIVLDHGNGFRTKYAHLKKGLVQKGDLVKRGQVIGLVGNSGRSTGPHLHYEIQYNDKIVNPTRFVRIAKYLKRANKK
ncbi:MAG: M23 family metallopeptidase [Deltaproteobacteria bacterium]|nr:M23 family metallopeptidase [Deltaproteobacteria bacterium]